MKKNNKNMRISCLIAGALMTFGLYKISSLDVRALQNIDYQELLDKQTDSFTEDLESIDNFGDNDFLFDKSGKLIAYYGKSGAKNIVLPENTKGIGAYAFSGHSEIESIIVPNGVSSIDQYAFFGCSGLKSLEIPDSVVHIGDSAFSGCSSLESIKMGKSVKDIGVMNFFLCSSLLNISVSEENNFYSCHKGVLYSKDFSSIIAVPNGLSGKFINEKSAKKIGKYAFAGCSKLVNIDLKNSVEEIDECAFCYCSSLMSIKLGEKLKSVGFWAFSCCDYLDDVCLPETVESIGDYAFSNCTSLKKAVIKSKDAKIGKDIFKNCNKELEVNGHENSTIEHYAAKKGLDFVFKG